MGIALIRIELKLRNFRQIMKYLQMLSNSKSAGEADWGYVPYILILIAGIFWTIAWVYPNEHNLNFTQTSIVRGFSVIIMNYLMCRVFKVPIDFKKPVPFKYLAIRSIIQVVHGFVFSFSQYILPLPVVHTINCCGALFVFLIDYFINGIKTNSKQNVGILVGLIGVLVATNGPLLTKYINPEYVYHSKFQNYVTDDIFIKSIFSIFYMAVVGLWAYSVANTYQINYILGIGLVLGGGLAYPFSPRSSSTSSLLTSFLAFGLVLVIVQWFYIGALTMTKNHGVLTMMGFSSIFVGYLISIIRYGQKPLFITTVGIIMLFYGMWKAVFNKER